MSEGIPFSPFFQLFLNYGIVVTKRQENNCFTVQSIHFHKLQLSAASTFGGPCAAESILSGPSGGLQEEEDRVLRYPFHYLRRDPVLKNDL